MADGLVAVDMVDVVGSPYEQVAEGDYSGLVQFHPGADEAVKAGQAFAEGDWATGVLSIAGGAAELVDMITDPIAMLGSSVAGFLLDYMPPLPQMLDTLAGNPALVEGIGETWINVANEVEQAAADLWSSVQSVLGGWGGQAATAYAAAMAALVDAMNKGAFAARCIGDGMRVASGIVQCVRGFTKDVIAELVGQLISWAAQVAATAGLGASWVIPKATTRIGTTVWDCKKLADMLVEALQKSQALSKVLEDKLGLLLDALAAIDDGTSRAEA